MEPFTSVPPLWIPWSYNYYQQLPSIMVRQCQEPPGLTSTGGAIAERMKQSLMREASPTQKI